MSSHNAPKYMNYNSFPGADSINWGSLPGFGAKSAFNMPNKRSNSGYAQKRPDSSEEYSELLGSLLAKYGPKTGHGSGRSLL